MRNGVNNGTSGGIVLDSKMLYNALDELAATRPMLVLNVLVNFLAEDITWVRENMSQVDKSTLKELVSKL